MKKKLLTQAIADELRGNSAFFPSTRTGERPNARTPERANGRTPERTPGERVLARNSFDIYEDQMESLRELSYKQKRNGQLGSMSQMVRDAIDRYIKEQSGS